LQYDWLFYPKERFMQILSLVVGKDAAAFDWAAAAK